MRNSPPRTFSLSGRTVHRCDYLVHRNIGIKELVTTDAFAVRAGVAWLQYNASELKRFV
jgi:hypothetical protein